MLREFPRYFRYVTLVTCSKDQHLNTHVLQPQYAHSLQQSLMPFSLGDSADNSDFYYLVCAKSSIR